MPRTIPSPHSARGRLGAATVNGASAETVEAARRDLAVANLQAAVRRSVDAGRRYLTDDDILAVIADVATWRVDGEQKAAVALLLAGDDG
jgi:hypothetical protein